ncbi:DUF6286 domain-containing protein [Streptomyces sp. NPDC058045]|uniref:DUF6286 domain-containing protein n=1 Tax=Streptomyces sp. NPDC058045 TaxID=3346311 RepID=UPI0036EBFC6F
MSTPEDPDGPTRPMPVLEREPEPPRAPAPVPPPGRVRRFWSPRRAPAVLIALLVFAGAGLLLYDIASVRTGHPAMQWRRTLARELARRPLDDTAVLAGAAFAAALGLWLLVLAATPGRRGVLTMLAPEPGLRAGLHRRAVAMVLRDRAMEVPGVQSVQVAAGRRRVKVRAVSHFRELDDVRDDLTRALTDGVGELGLARPPALGVRVSRSGRKG